jgi:hypothetical protein
MIVMEQDGMDSQMSLDLETHQNHQQLGATTVVDGGVGVHGVRARMRRGRYPAF